MEFTISKPLCGFICFTLLLNMTASLTPEQACSKIDNGVNEYGCKQFKNLDYWTESNLRSICQDSGFTDKHSNASVCEPYKDKEFYETSLKLAILNTMYGPRATPQYGKCPWFCMYHPIYVDGSSAVGFKWSVKNNCWRVLLGATNRLCYVHSYREFAWNKVKNWCQGSTCEASTLLNRLREKGLPSNPNGEYDPKGKTGRGKPGRPRRPRLGLPGRREPPKIPGRVKSGKPTPGTPASPRLGKSGRPGPRKRGKVGRGKPGRPRPGRHTRPKPGKPDGSRKPGKPIKRKSRKKPEKPQKADVTGKVEDNADTSNPAKELLAEDLADLI